MSTISSRARPALGRAAMRRCAGAATALVAVGLLPGAAGATTAGPVVEVGAPAGAGQRAPAISWEPDPNLPGGGVYLVVWEDDRNAAMFGTDLFAARVRPDGTFVPADAAGVSFLEAAVRSGDQVQASVTYAASASPPVHFIVWTDPRNGPTDLYGARFITSTMTAIESSGFRITSSAGDSDAFPSVAFGGTNYLVAYQTNAAGGLEINVQRILAQIGLDGPPVRASSAAGLNPAVVAEGGRFVLGFETALGGLRAGAVPEVGTIGSVTTSTLSTSTSAQSLVRLAPLGQDLLAVWQDARNADRDIYGVRIDPATLMPRGRDFAIARARNDQLAPDIAGDAQGTLAVWQDRRNTATNAQIFGARIDASTGNVLDEPGFPLFAFNANAFEAAVEKGPGRDYLVAAIRFGQPSRLFLRVVRDEDPTGTLTPQGRTVVPADGTSTATVGFGVVRGPSMLPVVDGTLFDLRLSSSSPAIVEPDADPSRPGHQLRTADGRVRFSLRSTARETVTATVTSVEGDARGVASIVFQNVAPVATDIRITPTSPRSVEDLNLQYTYFDINGDPEGMSEIVWLRDNGTQPMFNDATTVPASATTRGEVWRAWVRPSDGLVRNPSRAFSSTVTIGNTPPEVVNASIAREGMPGVAPRTGSRIVLDYRFTDADQDSEQGTRIRWTDRGNPAPALDGARLVPGSMVVKDQVWQAAITPNDGREDGATVTTGTLAVVNTPPRAVVPPAQTVLERRTATLDGTMSSDVDPQDTLTYRWTQVVGPPVTLDDPTSGAPSFTAPSVAFETNLQFELEVSDGEASDRGDRRVVVDVEAVADADGDGLDDEEEMTEGTDPMSSDTDRDQLDDLAEVEGMLDPLDRDSDDDGLRDGFEGRTSRNDRMADPLGDADGDGMPNALDPDADDDGLPDGLELGVAEPLSPGTGMFAYAGTDEAAGVFAADLDVSTTTDPTRADSDGDGLSDGAEDANANGRVDDGESDPNDPLDPGVACQSDAMCPGTLVCQNGMCAEPEPEPMCDPLPESVECCEGPCEAASPVVDAVCAAGATRARCPVGASQCVAGTCMGMAPPPPPDEGCSCRASEPQGSGRRPGGPLLATVALGLFGLSRRRRHR